MYCIKCASLVDNDSKYCSSCGTPTNPQKDAIDGETLRRVTGPTEPNLRLSDPSWAIFRPVIRTLILINVCLIFLAISLSSGGYFELDGLIGQAQKISTESETMEAILFVLFAILYLIGMVGLWRSARWSRWTFTAWVAFSSVVFLEPTVSHPIEVLIDDMFNLTLGAILAVIWITVIPIGSTSSVKLARKL